MWLAFVAATASAANEPVAKPIAIAQHSVAAIPAEQQGVVVAAIIAKVPPSVAIRCPFERRVRGHARLDNLAAQKIANALAASPLYHAYPPAAHDHLPAQSFPPTRYV